MVRVMEEQVAAGVGRVPETEVESSGMASDVLEALLHHWPMAWDIYPQELGLTNDATRDRFAHVIQALLDQGFITYEAADSYFGQTCFRDALITPSGRMALRVMRFMAGLA